MEEDEGGRYTNNQLFIGINKSYQSGILLRRNNSLYKL